MAINKISDKRYRFAQDGYERWLKDDAGFLARALNDTRHMSKVAREFGGDFRRDQQAGGLNAMLNYGYTVLRATTARAVVAAGLHPTMGLHHSNQGNAMRLVDDLMEPFRPMIDLKVWQLNKQGESIVTPETKRALVRTMYDDMQTSTGATPVIVCTQKLATSLAQIFIGEKDKLDLPLPGLPLDLAVALQDE